MAYVRYAQKQQKKPGEVERTPLGTSAPGSAAPAGPAPAPGPTGATSAPGGNFTNLQDYLTANQSQAKATAGNLGNDLEYEGNLVSGANPTAKQGARPGAPKMLAQGGVNRKFTEVSQGPASDLARAEKVSEQARLLGSPSGQSQVMRQQAEKTGGVNQGENNLDAALLGYGGGGRLSQLSQKYGGLAGRVRADQADREAMKPRLERVAQQDPTQSDHNKKGVIEGAKGNAPDGTPWDKSGGAQGDPNQMDDETLWSMGYGHSQAPGETYAHYSDRIAARK